MPSSKSEEDKAPSRSSGVDEKESQKGRKEMKEGSLAASRQKIKEINGKKRSRRSRLHRGKNVRRPGE